MNTNNYEFSKFIDEVFFGRLNFCGCGNPENILELIYKALIEIRDNSAKDVDLLTLYILDSAGLTGHGSSVCSSWLEDDARLFISDYESINENSQ